MLILWDSFIRNNFITLVHAVRLEHCFFQVPLIKWRGVCYIYPLDVASAIEDLYIYFCTTTTICCKLLYEYARHYQTRVRTLTTYQEQLTISSFGVIKAFKIPSRAFLPLMVLTSISWSIIIYNISIYTLSDLGDLSNLICYLGLFNIIIYTLSDLGDSSNLIGSLFRTVTFYKITKIVRAL